MEEVPDETKREGRGRESREVGERERSRVRHEDAFSRWGVNSAALRLPLSAASSCNHQHKAPLSILLRPPTLPAHNNRTLSRFSLSFSFFHSFALSSVYALLPLLSLCSYPRCFLLSTSLWAYALADIARLSKRKYLMLDYQNLSWECIKKEVERDFDSKKVGAIRRHNILFINE